MGSCPGLKPFSSLLGPLTLLANECRCCIPAAATAAVGHHADAAAGHIGVAITARAVTSAGAPILAAAAACCRSFHAPSAAAMALSHFKAHLVLVSVLVLVLVLVLVSMLILQGKMLKLLEDHISLDSNFVVVIGNPGVGAPRGCKDALDSLLNRFEAAGKSCAGFVFTPCTSVHLEGPAFRFVITAIILQMMLNETEVA